MGRLMVVNVGDTVRLAPEITVEEFGLSLCDDDGAPIEIDTEVLNVGQVYLTVRIKRMLGLTQLTPPQEMAVTRLVRPEHVVDVVNHSPNIWPHAAALNSVCAARDGKPRSTDQPVFWSVSVDAIPQGDLKF